MALSVIGAVIAYLVWVNVHPIAGIVLGFLLVGGLGWALLGSLFAKVAFVFMPERKRLTGEFLPAWEERYGTIPLTGRDERSRLAYQLWLRANRQFGIAAADFLDRTKAPDDRRHLAVTEDGRGVTLELRIALDGMPLWTWKYDSDLSSSLAINSFVETEIERLQREWDS